MPRSCPRTRVVAVPQRREASGQIRKRLTEVLESWVAVRSGRGPRRGSRGEMCLGGRDPELVGAARRHRGALSKGQARLGRDAALAEEKGPGWARGLVLSLRTERSPRTLSAAVLLVAGSRGQKFQAGASPEAVCTGQGAAH